MAKSKFNLGDKVRNGAHTGTHTTPIMTVHNFRRQTNDDTLYDPNELGINPMYVICKYFYQGQFIEEAFNENELVKVG